MELSEHSHSDGEKYDDVCHDLDGNNKHVLVYTLAFKKDSENAG